MKRFTVLRTVVGRTSPVGREEAVERRQHANFKHPSVGRFSQAQAILSSGD
jgi:hypothetical protein